MVQGKVLGKDKNPLNFKAESGETIAGHRLWLGFTEDGFEGIFPAKFFVKIGDANVPIGNLQVGSMYTFSFDRRGKLAGVANSK